MTSFLPKGLSAEGTVSIHVSKPKTLVAPAQVWVAASGHTDLATFEEDGDVYDGAFHEYYHEWTINGEPLSRWNSPTNLIAEHNNPNKAFGKEVAFCLTDAGDYVIDLVVTDRNGKIARASTSMITVVAPESYFPNNRRLYVSLSGDFTGVPAGANKVTTLDDMDDFMNAKPWANDLWVRFKRGDVYDMTNFRTGNTAQAIRGSMRMIANTPCFYMSDWGDEQDARPKFTPSTEIVRSGGSLFEFWEGIGSIFCTATGLDFEGGYDAGIERGDMGTTGGAFGLYSWGGTFINFYDINVDGLGKGFYVASLTHQHVMIADTSVTNWYDYAIFGGYYDQRIAYVGNRIAQNLNAPKGDGSSFQNYHGPIRIMSSVAAYISGNDLFSRNGRNEAAYQPCLRLCVATEPNEYAIVERNSMEGGFEVIQIMKKMPGGDPCPMNCLVERNTLSANSYTGTIITTERSGITIRDNLFIAPNAPRFQYGPILPAILGIKPDYEIPINDFNPSDPLVIYSNTYINLMDTSSDGNGVSWPLFHNYGTYFTNVTEENNVTHNPYLDTPTRTFAPIDLSTPIRGYALRYLGKRADFTIPRITLSGDVVDDASFKVNYSDVGQGLQDGTSLGGATDQAYWAVIEATDTRHQMFINGNRLYAERGHFEVSFDASVITITNRSGLTWTAESIEFYLDRTSLIPPLDSATASPPTVPLPRPTKGSPAIGAATKGRVSSKDFLLSDRGATPSRGALEPTSS